MDESPPTSAGRLRVGKQWEESACASVRVCQSSLIRGKKILLQTTARQITKADRTKKRKEAHEGEHKQRGKGKSFEEVK